MLIKTKIIKEVTSSIINFKSKFKPQDPVGKWNKKDIQKNLYTLFDGRESVLDAFESSIFPVKIEGKGFSDLAREAEVSDHRRENVSDYSNIKILTPKQNL